MILALFTGTPDASIGGAQRSAQMAWRSLREVAAQNGTRAVSMWYDPLSRTLSQVRPDEIVLRSRGEAILGALRQSGKATLILVWHLDLLKLLPFLRAPRARVVLTLLGIEAWRPLAASMGALVKSANHLLTISHHTWQRFITGNPSLETCPHTTVYLGIGTPLKTPTPASNSSPVLLMISRLEVSEAYKGHRELIAAMPRVLERIPNAELWIAGDGNFRLTLEEASRYHRVTRAVRFWGEVTQAEKESLLQQARALAMPSRGEGFGLVYLEAMRVGRPCLVSNCDAGQEVVNPPEAGLAVDPGDSQALADAVCRLLTPGDEWEAWSRKARRRYEANFTAAHFQQRLVRALFPES